KGRRTAEVGANFAKRMECVQLAGAVEWLQTHRKREQAPRTPYASRGILPQKILAACEEFGLLECRTAEGGANFAKRMDCVQLASAVEWLQTHRKREQAPRTPYASRGILPQKILAACEEFGLLECRTAEGGANFA